MRAVKLVFSLIYGKRKVCKLLVSTIALFEIKDIIFKTGKILHSLRNVYPLVSCVH